MHESNHHINFEKSRNGLTVPYIEGVYLHSIYNPTKEADQLAEEYEQNLKSKNYVLVLGLGFGYHIEAIAKKLNHHHGSYKIVVLETNKALIEQFINTRAFEDTNISIIYFNNNVDLYSNPDFTNFLKHKPTVIRHEPSFSINDQKYIEFLKFKASESKDVYNKTINQNAKDILDLHHFDHVSRINKVKQDANIKSKADYLLFAFSEIANMGKKS